MTQETNQGMGLKDTDGLVYMEPKQTRSEIEFFNVIPLEFEHAKEKNNQILNGFQSILSSFILKLWKLEYADICNKYILSPKQYKNNVLRKFILDKLILENYMIQLSVIIPYLKKSGFKHTDSGIRTITFVDRDLSCGKILIDLNSSDTNVSVMILHGRNKYCKESYQAILYDYPTDNTDKSKITKHVASFSDLFEMVEK